MPALWTGPGRTTLWVRTPGLSLEPALGPALRPCCPGLPGLLLLSLWGQPVPTPWLQGGDVRRSPPALLVLALRLSACQPRRLPPRLLAPVPKWAPCRAPGRLWGIEDPTGHKPFSTFPHELRLPEAVMGWLLEPLLTWWAVCNVHPTDVGPHSSAQPGEVPPASSEPPPQPHGPIVAASLLGEQYSLDGRQEVSSHTSSSFALPGRRGGPELGLSVEAWLAA